MGKNYLYVIRDDGEYDYKAGFKSYKEANEYRQECQRRWINHCDVVVLCTETEDGVVTREVDLTELNDNKRNFLLEDANIPVE